MKTYIDKGNVIGYNSLWIPKDLTNADYIRFLEEIKSNEATLIPDSINSITWSEIIFQRDQLLKETDWVVLPGTNISNKEEWLQYRQILRDIPQSFKTPESVIWPVKPLLLEEV